VDPGLDLDVVAKKEMSGEISGSHGGEYAESQKKIIFRRV
jgi:hypothetical protein